MITRTLIDELLDLLGKLADEAGKTMDESQDQDEIDILRPIYRMAQQLGNELEAL